MPKAAAAAVTGAPANGEPHDTIYDIKATLHRLPLLLTKNESEKYNNIYYLWDLREFWGRRTKKRKLGQAEESLLRQYNYTIKLWTTANNRFTDVFCQTVLVVCATRLLLSLLCCQSVQAHTSLGTVTMQVWPGLFWHLMQFETREDARNRHIFANVIVVLQPRKMIGDRQT